MKIIIFLECYIILFGSMRVLMPSMRVDTKSGAECPYKRGKDDQGRTIKHT